MAENQGTEIQPIEPPLIAGQSKAFDPTIVITNNREDGVRERIVGTRDRRSSSSSSSDGHTQHHEGKSLLGEENVREALHRLRDTLNAGTGSPMLWQEHAGHSDISVDGTITATDGRVLLCQVRRVEREATLRDLGRYQQATTSHDSDELAGNLVAAVEAKKNAAHRTMTLVLDTNFGPAYTADPAVVVLAKQSWHRVASLVSGSRYGWSGPPCPTRNASTARCLLPASRRLHSIANAPVASRRRARNSARSS